MKNKSLIAAITLVLITVAVTLFYRVAQARETPAFRFVTVEKGDLQSTVSATGALNAVTSVSVGTQVSGQVSELLVDFNDHVKKGQLLARIDPTLAQQAVVDAQANVERNQAQLLQAQRDYARNRTLTDDGLVARSEYEVSQASLGVAAANVKSAKVALDRARQNLTYTNITAPIDGVVVERNVALGQTVAASLSAPQLFLIANDLSHMQILAQVDESDIASIREGQPVAFTVQALPGQTFKGEVKQVRLQSVTVENVVSYTVVAQVDNPGNKLLPGMTARVDFLVKSATGVLKVSNAALRFRPSADLQVQLTANAATATTSTSATSTSTASSRRGNGTARTKNGAPSSFGTLYFLDANGKPATARVRTGINDGSSTQVMGKSVTEGMKVIAGTADVKTAATTTTAGSPFQSNQQQGGRPRSGSGF
ncbi:MAG: efflux RND transporter periplasmic adaptor subunit [Acidobacteriota bacterium]